MFGALTLITFRQWRRHKLRLALTLVGIALGVAVFFAVRTANTTLVENLRFTVEKLAGKATLQITAGEAGFSQNILKTVKQTEGVKLAEPVIETVARTAAEENLLVLGLDTASDLELHSAIISEDGISMSNPLAFINRADSIAVSRTFAERNNLKEGDFLELYTQNGKQKFTVRGFFNPVGAGEVFGGNVAVLDIFAAQPVFGRGENFDRIDIMTAPNIPIEQTLAALREKLPKGLDVARPSGRGQSLENATKSVQLGLLITSFLALTIGVFLIFNSFNISINQRWKEIGILRALGVSRRQTQLMFLGEAFVLGLIGSAVGVAFGFYLAVAATRIMNGVSASFYGLITSAQMPKFRLDYALLAFVVGVIASLFSAWLPARSAAKLDPVLALHNIETRQKEAVIGLPRLTFGFAFIVLGLGLTQFAAVSVGLMFQLAYAVFIQLGMILILPLLIVWGGRILRPLMDKFFGMEGVIAVDAMRRAPRRTSATVGALMIGLSFVFSNGAFIQSQKAAVSRSLDRAVNADYLITTSEQVRSRVYHFSEETAQRVASLQGIKRAENLRLTTINFKGDEVAIIAHDIDAWLTRAPDVLDEGDAATAQKSGADGEGFFVSQNFAARFGVKLNDPITLETPSGALSLPVVGILEYYHSEIGTIFLDRKLYKKLWNDDAIDYILVTLTPEANRAAFKSEVERAIAGEQRAFIYTREEYKRWGMNLIDQFFTLTYLQMLVAIFVAGLGLVNTMIISVSERRREIGVLRAIGGLRGQIRKMILLEAVSISLIGIATGVISGFFNAYFLVHTAAKIIAGFTLPLKFPLTMVLIALPTVLIVALISAWLPANRAARLRVVEAIGYE